MFLKLCLPQYYDILTLSDNVCLLRKLLNEPQNSRNSIFALRNRNQFVTCYDVTGQKILFDKRYEGAEMETYGVGWVEI